MSSSSIFVLDGQKLRRQQKDHANIIPNVLERRLTEGAPLQELQCVELAPDLLESVKECFRKYTETKAGYSLAALRLTKGTLKSIDSISYLKEMLYYFHEIQTLDLSDNPQLKTTDGGLEQLVQSIVSCVQTNADTHCENGSCRHYLSHLSLAHNKLGEKAALTWIGYLLRNYKTDDMNARYVLECLDLGYNGIAAKGMKELSTNLSVCASLRSLDLTKNKLDDRAIGYLASAVLDPRTRIRSHSSPERNNGHPANGHTRHDADDEMCCHLTLLNLTNNKIGYRGAYTLADCFVKGNNQTLQVLNLNDNSIEVEGAEAMGVALKFSHGLRELYLSGNKIGNDGIRVIARGLKENRDSGLRILDVSWNGIKDDGAGYIADMLRHHPNLQYLSLRSNYICDDGINKLAKALPSVVALDELDLVGNQMRDPTGLINAMCHYETKLMTIHCERNQLSPEAETRLKAAFDFRLNKEGWLGRILRSIRSRKRLTCDMIGRKHSDEDIIAVARLAGRYRPQIRVAAFGAESEKGFSSSMVTARGLAYFAKNVVAVREINLGSLIVRHSPICDVGASAIAQSLTPNSTLRCLYLINCGITEKGAADIALALRRNNNLTRLSLDMNQIGDEGLCAIFQLLGDPDDCPPNLVSLKVANNGITDAGVSKMPPIERLDELHLDGNSLTDFGALDLAKAVYSNTTLRWLNVSRNKLTNKGAATLSMFLPNKFVLDCDEK